MFKRNKPAIVFLLKFVIVYASLSAVYSYYLSTYEQGEIPEVDAFTYEVAEESSDLAKLFGFESSIEINDDEASVKFLFDGFYRVKIVEGCNGLSVMILFLAFIVAFGGRLRDKLFFIPLGIALIHISNIVRLTWLTYIYVYYYDYAQAFHDYVFPSIIYGMVFVLWVVWVNYFAFRVKKVNIYEK
ncbi:MAG: exosortase family protein XrtF [Bacteroidota bacterium]